MLTMLPPPLLLLLLLSLLLWHLRCNVLVGVLQLLARKQAEATIPDVDRLGYKLVNHQRKDIRRSDERVQNIMTTPLLVSTICNDEQQPSFTVNTSTGSTSITAVWYMFRNCSTTNATSSNHSIQNYNNIATFDEYPIPH
jgi:hypothetical protein